MYHCAEAGTIGAAVGDGDSGDEAHFGRIAAMAAASEVAEPQQSTAKDLIAGTIAGWAQVLAGQPFDCVKVVIALIDPADGRRFACSPLRATEARSTRSNGSSPRKGR